MRESRYGSDEAGQVVDVRSDQAASCEKPKRRGFRCIAFGLPSTDPSLSNTHCTHTMHFVCLQNVKHIIVVDGDPDGKSR